MIHSVDDNIKKIAEASAIKRIPSEYNRSKFEYDKRISMLIIGCIGELVFQKVLEIANIPFDSSYDAGEVDNFDFLIGGQVYDAKTSYCDGNYRKLNLLYSEDQYISGTAKEYDWVIQLFINGRDKDGEFALDLCNQAMIAGAIKFKKIENYPNPDRKGFGDYYKVPLSKLSQFKTIS